MGLHELVGTRGLGFRDLGFRVKGLRTSQIYTRLLNSTLKPSGLRPQYPKMGVDQNEGYFFGGPNNKDYNILGSILGSLYFGKLPNIMNAKFRILWLNRLKWLQHILLVLGLLEKRQCIADHALPQPACAFHCFRRFRLGGPPTL